VKRIALILVVALVASGSTLAIASSQRATPPAGSADRRAGVTLGEISRNLQKLDELRPVQRVTCRTLTCINRTLTKQSQAINNLKRNLRALSKDFYNCEVLQGVSQFSDFAADGGGTTTGLDFDTPGTPDMWAVEWICGVV
jgi:hypothetical protein